MVTRHSHLQVARTEHVYYNPARLMEQGFLAVYFPYNGKRSLGAQRTPSYTQRTPLIHLLLQALGCWFRVPGFVLREPPVQGVPWQSSALGIGAASRGLRVSLSLSS